MASCKKKEVVDTTIYHRDGEVKKLYYNNPNGVNIVVLGDGFDQKDLKEGGRFDIDAKRGIDHLFTVEPFKSYKQYFNIYLVYAESLKSGVTADHFYASNYDTQFKAFYRPGIFADINWAYHYAEKAVANDKISAMILIANIDEFGGTTYERASVITNQVNFEHTLVHELGHSFAGLGDEYIFESNAVRPVSQVKFYPNLDTTGDIKQVKWAHFFENNTKYNHVLGAFAGGYFREEGVYRPEQTSVMREVSTLSFNAPSREAIVRKIHQVVGIPFNFQEFLKSDEASINPSFFIGTSSFKLPASDFIGKEEVERIMKNGKN
jgi:hypothetical protein